MGYHGTRTGSSSQLAILTPNQRENIIRKERERRRLIRHPTGTPRRSRRSQITREELARAIHRHREALNKLRRENEREQRRRELILERRRKAREVANVRSRRI
ncbi:unnamed protein product [Onchocerca flexuosa]|uniref:Uncharacterized protein n=1 Tax=Onchocerca flexuosa TaxID=387005 RepID=A0A183I7K8_9BILA|nr:unnamed protein product [Onchocerca flexuosa]